MIRHGTQFRKPARYHGRTYGPAFDCAWPTTSQHLRVLEKAGLVTITMRGRERVYRLEAERLRSVAGGWLGRFG